MKVKEKATEVLDTTKTVSMNVSEFVNGVALVVVSVFAMVEAWKHRDNVWYMALFAAGGLIALQGGVLLYRHFNVKR